MTRRPPHRLVEKPVPYRFLQIMTCRDWTEEAAREIKKDHREWRALMGELFHLANGYEFRFEAGYVSGLLQQELGRFFLPQDPQKHGRRGLAHHLDEFDTRVLLVDRWFHVSPQIFDMSFTHPETGQAHGFLYEPTTKDDMTDKGCVMHAHSASPSTASTTLATPSTTSSVLTCTARAWTCRGGITRCLKPEQWRWS